MQREKKGAHQERSTINIPDIGPAAVQSESTADRFASEIGSRGRGAAWLQSEAPRAALYRTVCHCLKLLETHNCRPFIGVSRYDLVLPVRSKRLNSIRPGARHNSEHFHVVSMVPDTLGSTHDC